MNNTYKILEKDSLTDNYVFPPEDSISLDTVEPFGDFAAQGTTITLFCESFKCFTKDCTREQGPLGTFGICGC